MRLILIFSGLAMASWSYASDRAEFCESARNPNFLKEQLNERENLIAFTNPRAGIANGGLCWWHSRFQRNATYLANFRPEKPKPNEKELKKIIRKLALGNGLGRMAVVEVPGFNNLLEFSRAYRRELVRYFERWQVREGVVLGSWAYRGLAGASRNSARRLERRMDRLFELVEGKNQIVYVKLQMPGVVSHSWLVTGMEKTGDGYVLEFLDSNYIGKRRYKYIQGMRHFGTQRRPFVPYIEYQNEISRAKRAIRRYCDQV